MNLEMIFAWTLMLIPVLNLVKDLREETEWSARIIRWAIYTIAIFLFWSFHEMFETVVNNFVTKIIMSSSNQGEAAIIITSLMLLIIFGVIWYILNHFVIKPQTAFAKIVTWGITIIGASSAASIYYGTANGLTDLTPIIVSEAGILLSISIIIYWKSKLQNTLAIPCALALAVGVTLYYHYCKTGINIIEMYKLDPMSIGPWAIGLAIGTAYSTLFDKGEDWDKRWAYKLLNIYLIIMMGLSLNLGINNFYGGHTIARDNLAKMNILQEQLLTKKLERIEKITLNELIIHQKEEISSYFDMKISKAEPSEIPEIIKNQSRMNHELDEIMFWARQGNYINMDATKADRMQNDPNTSLEAIKAIAFYRQETGKMMRQAIEEKPKNELLYNRGKVPGIKIPWFSKEKEGEDKKIHQNPIPHKVNGKLLRIKLEPGEKMEVDKIEEKGEWKYKNAAGLISHRIQRPGKRSCWRDVQVNEPWRADWKGTLEVKNTSNGTVFFQVIIL